MLPVDQMVPAPGQGAIAVQTRSVDRGKFSVLGDPATEAAVGLERKILDGMGRWLSGCTWSPCPQWNNLLLSPSYRNYKD